MSNFDKSFQVLMRLEFNSPSNYLHKNKTERDYTVAGVYKYAHPNWLGWFIVSDTIQKCQGETETASKELYKNTHLTELVMKFYKQKFWDRMRLDEVHSNNTATELFILGVNIGCRNAVRKAQKVVGVDTDGLIGKISIGALNDFDEGVFDLEFDKLEIKYYEDLIDRRPSLAIYAKGWRNRANYV